MPHLLNLRATTVVQVGRQTVRTSALVARVGHVYPVSGTDWTVLSVMSADGNWFKLPTGTATVVCLKTGAVASEQLWSGDPPGC